MALFFVFVHLVQEYKKWGENLVQDYIFTSCTRSGIIYSTVKQQTKTKSTLTT